MSGHYATLLRGTVEALLDEHDVYVTDWADARDVPLSAGRFDLDDYIGYVKDYIRALGPDVHVIAVCQPAPGRPCGSRAFGGRRRSRAAALDDADGRARRRAHRADGADEARRGQLARVVRARAHDARAAVVCRRGARGVSGLSADRRVHVDASAAAHGRAREDLRGSRARRRRVRAEAARVLRRVPQRHGHHRGVLPPDRRRSVSARDARDAAR